MTGRTHDLAAFTALNIATIHLSPTSLSLATAIFALGACFIGGLTPDLDQPAAKFWQRLPAGTFLGRIFSNLFWRHRTISHSLFGLFIFYWVSSFVTVWMGTFMTVDTTVLRDAFIIGFISHLVFDAFTQEGVPWFFPIKWYLGFPPLSFLRINSGGNLEKYFVFPALLFFNGYLFWKNYALYLNLFHQFF